MGGTSRRAERERVDRGEGLGCIFSASTAVLAVLLPHPFRPQVGNGLSLLSVSGASNLVDFLLLAQISVLVPSLESLS